MAAGTWELAPCSHREVEALAAALEIDEVTAAVLVRRGYSRPGRRGTVPRRRPARARSVPARRHARGGRDDHRSRRVRCAHLRARRLRRRRHLRDRARSAAAARARRRPGLAPAVPLRGGLRAEQRDADAAGRARASTSFSPSTAASPPSTRSRTPRRSVSRSSSPTITGPPRSFPACPVVATLKGDYPFTGLAARRSSGSSPQALLGAGASVPRATPRHRRARDRRRRRAARRREPRARTARPAAPRADAEAGAAGAHARRRRRPRPPSTSRRSASGSRRGSTRPAGSADPRRR